MRNWCKRGEAAVRSTSGQRWRQTSVSAHSNWLFLLICGLSNYIDVHIFVSLHVKLRQQNMLERHIVSWCPHLTGSNTICFFWFFLIQSYHFTVRLSMGLKVLIISNPCTVNIRVTLYCGLNIKCMLDGI